MIDVGPIVNEGHGLVVTSGQGRPVREVSEHRGAGAPRKRTGPVVDSRYRNHTVTFINVIVVVIVEVIVIVIVVVETDFVDGGAVFLDAREATDVLPLPDFHDVRRHLGGVGVLLGQEGRGGEGGREGRRKGGTPGLAFCDSHRWKRKSANTGGIPGKAGDRDTRPPPPPFLHRRRRRETIFRGLSSMRWRKSREIPARVSYCNIFAQRTDAILFLSRTRRGLLFLTDQSKFPFGV